MGKVYGCLPVFTVTGYRQNTWMDTEDPVTLATGNRGARFDCATIEDARKRARENQVSLQRSSMLILSADLTPAGMTIQIEETIHPQNCYTIPL